MSDFILDTLEDLPQCALLSLSLSEKDHTQLVGALDNVSKKSGKGSGSREQYWIAPAPGDASINLSSKKEKGYTPLVLHWKSITMANPDDVLPIASLHTKGAWEWEEDHAGLTTPTLFKGDDNYLLFPLSHSLPFINMSSRGVVAGPTERWCENTKWERISTARHLYVPFAETSEFLAGALSDCEDNALSRWDNIFNDRFPVPGRSGDTNARQVCYGQLANGSKSRGNFVLYRMPGVLNWAKHIAAKLGPKYRPVAIGIVRVSSNLLQHLHCDIDVDDVPPGVNVWTAFMPLCPCPPDNETASRWVLNSHEGLPRPWVVRPMSAEAGSTTIIDSRALHLGGCSPKSLEPGEYRHMWIYGSYVR